MKAYGKHRHDALVCKYGCCRMKGDERKTKQYKKRARREAINGR